MDRKYIEMTFDVEDMNTLENVDMRAVCMRMGGGDVPRGMTQGASAGGLLHGHC